MPSFKSQLKKSLQQYPSTLHTHYLWFGLCHVLVDDTWMRRAKSAYYTTSRSITKLALIVEHTLTIARGIIGASPSSASSAIGPGALNGWRSALIRGVAFLLFRTSGGRRPKAHANLPQLLVNLESFHPQLFHFLHWQLSQPNISTSTALLLEPKVAFQ